MLHEEVGLSSLFEIKSDQTDRGSSSTSLMQVAMCNLRDGGTSRAVLKDPCSAGFDRCSKVGAGIQDTTSPKESKEGEQKETQHRALWDNSKESTWSRCGS